MMIQDTCADLLSILKASHRNRVIILKNTFRKAETVSLRYLTRIALLAVVCVVLAMLLLLACPISSITALYFPLVDFEDLKGLLLVMSISIFVSSSLE